jgi:lysophospholipase L1-like esterase
MPVSEAWTVSEQCREIDMQRFMIKGTVYVRMVPGFLIYPLMLFLFVSCSFAPNISMPHAQAKSTNTKSQQATPASSVHAPTPGPGPWPVISRNVPAFSSAGYYPAAQANDGSYDTYWRSQGTPAWLAYDLSATPMAERQQVLLVWYNDQTASYDHTAIKNYAYNLPQDYTIDANAAPGGTAAPTTGWVTLLKVQGNRYHSRQHILNMAGYNWIRMYVTAVDGAPENEDVSINMDVYDAHMGTSDDWIFFGDSITQGAMDHETLGGIVSFGQLINEQVPTAFPVEESGGIGYLTTVEGVQFLPTWLPMFPGKYVGLSYGTNDANECENPDTFYQNYVTMVEDVIQAGKIPIVPLIPWGATPNIQNCAPLLNAKIAILYTTFPKVVKGPDFWTFFQSHQDLISQDNIHPTEVGFGDYRQLWAQTLLAEVYK